VVTARDLEVAARVGIGACFHVFNPGAINPQRYFIFAFTGCGTGVATNTLAVIDNEAVVHKLLLPIIAVVCLIALIYFDGGERLSSWRPPLERGGI
jgi:hypothetical protein